MTARILTIVVPLLLVAFAAGLTWLYGDLVGRRRDQRDWRTGIADVKPDPTADAQMARQVRDEDPDKPRFLIHHAEEA